MNAAIESERRTGVDLEIFVTEHAELKDGNQVVVDLALEFYLSPGRGLGYISVQQIRRHGCHQAREGAGWNCHATGRAVRIGHERLVWRTIRFRKRKAFVGQLG